MATVRFESLYSDGDNCRFVYFSEDGPFHPLPLMAGYGAQLTERPEKLLVVQDPSAPLESILRAVARSGATQLLVIGCDSHQLVKAAAGQVAATALPAGNPLVLPQPFHQLANTTVLLYVADPEVRSRLMAQMGGPVHPAKLRVDLDHLRHNLEQHRAALKPGTQMAVMVKANAYGAGLIETARALEAEAVDYLTVAYVEEGVRLRRAGIKCPVMVLNPNSSGITALIEHNLEPVVGHFQLLNALNAIGERSGATLPVHLEFNTGMNRLGFEPEAAPRLSAFFQSQAGLKLETAFAHLAASGEAEHDAFTEHQAKRFSEAADTLRASVSSSFGRHLLNSGGIARFPQYDMDMVRLGIGLYGVDATQVLQPSLKRVMELQTEVAQVRVLQPGETVGYSRMGQVAPGRRIATLSIGYADGVPRALGNGRHQVLIRGQLAPLVGNVCMDMCMADVGHIPGVGIGDTVTVFGSQPTVQEVAKALNTIEYEVFTSVGERVCRAYQETYAPPAQ